MKSQLLDPASFQPEDYWKSLVSGDRPDDVDQVGHPDMGKAWNCWAYRLRAEQLLTLVRRNLNISPATRVFEAGFGVGYYLNIWKELGICSVAGIELSESAAKNCQRRFPMFDLRRGNLTELGRMEDFGEAASFDLVTAVDVLYHIMDDEIVEQILVELAHLVRPGGLLLLTEKSRGLRAAYDECGFVRRRPYEWYRAILSRLGFTATDSAPVFWGMDPPVDHSGLSLSLWLAKAWWWVMRAAVKPWLSKPQIQNVVGYVFGAIGYRLDKIALADGTATSNLVLLGFRRATL